MKRRQLDLETEASAQASATPTAQAPDTASQVKGIITAAEQYETDLEARYVAARDAWTHAMRAANGRRSADLATLAIAQEAYEAVMAEREHRLVGSRVAVPIEEADSRHALEVAVGQELAWRRVHEPNEPTGILHRIRRRFRRR